MTNDRPRIEPLPNRNREPKPLSAGLDRVVRSLGLPSSDSMSKLFHKWSEVVGEELAGRCQPVSLNRGNLVIRAADHAWATELRWLEKLIVDRCAATLGSGVVKRVSIRV